MTNTLTVLRERALAGDTQAREQLSWRAHHGDTSARQFLIEHELERFDLLDDGTPVLFTPPPPGLTFWQQHQHGTDVTSTTPAEELDFRLPILTRFSYAMVATFCCLALGVLIGLLYVLLIVFMTPPSS